MFIFTRVLVKDTKAEKDTKAVKDAAKVVGKEKGNPLPTLEKEFEREATLMVKRDRALISMDGAIVAENVAIRPRIVGIAFPTIPMEESDYVLKT